MAQKPKTAVEHFAAYAANLRAQDIAADVMHAAVRCVIDWYSAAIPGVVDPASIALRAALDEEVGHGTGYLLTGERAPVRIAALFNGTASHTTEFDDIFAPAIYHPGSPTIAAALAIAQQKKTNGAEFLVSVIGGYEISTRIGAALGRRHYKFWHNTGTVGSFGSAAAAGILLGLNQQQMIHALGGVGTFAAGLQQAFRGDSQSKPLHAGHAADYGVFAAQIAAKGLRGAPDILDGAVGMGVAMSDGPDWNAALEDLGKAFNTQRMTVKNHGCCGHIFAALDGVLELQRQHRFALKDVERIDIGGYSATVDVTGNYTADTPSAAKFCLPFILASGLKYGSIRLDAYTPDRLGDAEVKVAMGKIQVHLDPKIDALFPRQRAAHITLRLTDGRVAEYFQPHRVGDPQLPLSDAQLEDKFLEMACPVLGDRQARDFVTRLWALTSQPSMADHAMLCQIKLN